MYRGELENYYSNKLEKYYSNKIENYSIAIYFSVNERTSLQSYLRMIILRTWSSPATTMAFCTYHQTRVRSSPFFPG